MDRSSQAGEYCDLSGETQKPEPATIIIFGATGDLSARKVFPALYNLARSGLLHPATRVIGIGRRSMGAPEFRSLVRRGIEEFSHTGFEEKAWSSLGPGIDYLQGDLADPELYARLAARLAVPGIPSSFLYYLAVGPEQFSPIAKALGQAGLGSRGRELGAAFRRLIVEKPFGRDLASALALSTDLHEAFKERDIFRIDHYLGKETVQNLLYLRFANSIFEPLWNRNYIEKVEIEVLERGGIGSRGGYYDGAGAARDMLQNHLMQLLCLCAMEPPADLDPESIRDEKVKVLKAMPRYSAEDFRARSIRAQYVRGRESDAGPSYRDEAKVRPDSLTETYVALRLELDTWRFAGVPFVLRTGKAMDRQVSEIRVHFKRPPAGLFAGRCRERLPSNRLTLRVQPDEGLWLSFNAKIPGAPRVGRKELSFSYRDGGAYFPEAYERLLADALAGDSTLFIRSDEAEEAWRFIDGLVEAWNSPEAPPPLSYERGSPPPAFPGEGE